SSGLACNALARSFFRLLRQVLISAERVEESRRPRATPDRAARGACSAVRMGATQEIPEHPASSIWPGTIGTNHRKNGRFSSQMDFTWTPEQDAYRMDVRRWLEENRPQA